MNYQPYLWPAFRKRLLRSDKPILVGPWRSEVGFEALYWIPFLKKLIVDGLDPERLIPIGRGGSACWYGSQTGLELYAMRTPQQVRVENKRQHRETGLLKQTALTPFDDAVLEDAAAALHLGRDYHVLHPSWMYQTFAPFWESDRGLQWLNSRTAYAVLEPPPLPGGVTLPERFAVVRFYQRPTFTGHGLAGQAMLATLYRLADQIPVIVLSSDLHLDDHRDLMLAKIPNVTLLHELTPMLPENNLAVQSAVLARSVAFIGTYGGFAQLALRFGRSVISYYDQWAGTAIAHKHLSDALAIQMRIPFQVLSLHEIAFTQSVLPGVSVKSPQHLARPGVETVIA